MFLTSLVAQIKKVWDYIVYPSKYYAKKYAKRYAKEYSKTESKKLAYNITIDTNDNRDSDSISNNYDYNNYY